MNSVINSLFLPSAAENPFVFDSNYYTLLSSSAANSSNATVPQAQVIGEVSVTALQAVSFVVILPVILILLCCFSRQKSNTRSSSIAAADKSQQYDITDNQSRSNKNPYSKNKVILFSILLPSVIILIIVFGLRILNMLAFPVATFISAEKPLNVRVINALVYCGWSLNDWWLVVQFLFVGYIFLETSMKLRYISNKMYKLLFGLIIATPIVLGIVIVGYCVTVLVDQITKSTTTNSASQAAIIFFYSLSNFIFIGCVLSSLGYMIWTTVQLVRHLRSSCEHSGEFLQKTTKKAISRIIIIVTLVAIIALFLCVMELVSFIGEVSNISIYFKVISLIGKALATWIFIVGLCILFGPLSEMKQMVKNVMKNVTTENLAAKKRFLLEPTSPHTTTANSVSSFSGGESTSIEVTPNTATTIGSSTENNLVFEDQPQQQQQQQV